MNKDFGVMKSNIGTLIQDTSSSMATNIGVWINIRYRSVLQRFEWDELFHNFSLTSTATISACALDADVDRLSWILDATNGGYLAEYQEASFYQQYYDTFDDTGTPERYFLKWDVVKTQLASAEKVTIKSSSASDITQTLLVRGITTSGVETYDVLTLTGTIAVTAANTYTRILGLSKSASAVGNISVYHNDETTVLSLFSPQQLESRYLQMHIHPIHTGTVIYHAKALRRILPLYHSNDYPVVRDIADVLELGAVADGLRLKRQFSKAREYDFLFEKQLSEKIFQRDSRPNLIHQFIPTPLNRDDGLL